MAQIRTRFETARRAAESNPRVLRERHPQPTFWALVIADDLSFALVCGTRILGSTAKVM